MDRSRRTNIDEDDYFDMNSVASSTECTGLIQTPPLDDDGYDSYQDIYSFDKKKSQD